MVEVISHISVIEEIIVIDVVPKEIVKYKDSKKIKYPIWEPGSIFRYAGTRYNINDPPFRLGEF